ncbi:MAG: hypothetical protein M0Z94_12490 [Dehalococcoidales bacterium]|nr:hypothetical protein [Dehalococcoidales bacterium]
MDTKITRALLERALADNSGILPLEPTWVARLVAPPGKRLNLPDHAYDAGERGAIAERWLASCTKAENPVGPPDEGLSYLALEGPSRVSLVDALAAAGPDILGEAFAAKHNTLGYLAKLFDYADRLPYHFHPMGQHMAMIGKLPKDEAYYFVEGADLGPHPETFFGVHPYIAEEKKYDLLLPYLVDWNSNLILQHSRAYQQVAGEGFHLPAGIPHAPGTALTIELQEESDVGVVLQAVNAGQQLPKMRLSRHVPPEGWAKGGERYILEEMVDWDLSGDPYFYENRHMAPRLRSQQPGGEEYWIFYNTTKFSGKKMIVKPGQTFSSQDKGAYGLFVVQGRGTYGGHAVEGKKPGSDELLVSFDRATKPLDVKNTGDEDLIIIKFFGPDVNPDAPSIERRRAR